MEKRQEQKERQNIVRLSELGGKNIVNIYDGVRLGIIYEPNLTFVPETGKLEKLLVGSKSSLHGIWGDRRQIEIPWETVEKIGQEVVIVNLGQSSTKIKRNFFS